MNDDNKELLLRLGYGESECKKILKSRDHTRRIISIIDILGIELSKEKFYLISKLAQKHVRSIELIAHYIKDGKITAIEQLESSINYIQNHETIDINEFEQASGIGVTATEEDIRQAIMSSLTEYENDFESNTKTYFHKKIALKVKEKLPFAPAQDVSDQIFKIFKSYKFLSKKRKKPNKTANLPKKAKSTVHDGKTLIEEPEVEYLFKGVVKTFPSPAENSLNNSSDILTKHLSETNGKVITRFPPEPNGYLHIGHAKAMLLNFKYAEMNGGECILRIDDTNPSNESLFFYDQIEKDVKWMGYQYSKVTHTSDYFNHLYEAAIKLIKKGKAYVCHQTKKEIKDNIPSIWRDRPIVESIREFELMKAGFYNHGQATLRLKMETHDIVAYRIIHKPHPITKDEWCIYPTYFFSHPIVDSLENITHSFCSLEFAVHRESYYWVLDALGIYKPFLWEFSRLKLTYNILSKRIMKCMVNEGLVDGWDDPRLLTLAGMRRRGFTQAGIRNLCMDIGFTRNMDALIDYSKFEQMQRSDLSKFSQRGFALIDPMRVTILDLGDQIEMEIPLYEKDPDGKKGTRKIILKDVIYIEKFDFMEFPDPKFKRLTPSLPVNLKYVDVKLELVEIIRDNNNEVKELVCRRISEGKTLTNIHWISEGEYIECEIRLFDRLFLSPNPFDDDNWRSKINTDSKFIKQHCFVYKSIKDLDPYSHHQFERINSYLVDEDSKPDHLVFNRIIPNVNNIFLIQNQKIITNW